MSRSKTVRSLRIEIFSRTCEKLLSLEVDNEEALAGCFDPGIVVTEF